MEKDSHPSQQPRVNFMLSVGGAKTDYAKPFPIPSSPPVVSTIPSLLLQGALAGDPIAVLECSKLMEIPVEGAMECASTAHLTIKYSHSELKSMRTHLEKFTRHYRDYMTSQGEWEVCKQTASMSVLPLHMLPTPQNKDLLGVPVTQPMVDLLCAILQCTHDLKSSSANKVLHMWPAHYAQFGSFRIRFYKFATPNWSKRGSIHCQKRRC